MKAILIETTGKVSRIEIRDYKDIQVAVGGYIQWIPFAESNAAYVNEEGKLLNLPENYLATRLCFKYDVGLSSSDYISGNMVVVGQSDNDGSEMDIDDELAEALLKENRNESA
jgi:hypothetical protein